MLLLSILGLIAAALPGLSQVFVSDFNSGVPAGASVPAGPAGDPNEAKVDGGFLKLTDAINGTGGIFYIDDFDGGRPVKRFTATFKAYLFGSVCCGGGTLPADGFSFNLAPASSVVANPAYGQPAEEGLDSGLAVNFDTWDNGGGEAPSVEVKWLGQVIKRVNIPNVSGSPGGAATPAAAEKLVFINLDEDGTIDVTYGGITVCENVPTGYNAATIGVPKWVFGARTGGANDNHWIDDLKIVTAPAAQLVIAPQGSIWAYNDKTLTGSNLHGTGWELPGYDTNSAPNWKEGISLLGNDGAGVYDGAGQPFSGGINGFQTPLDRGTSERITFYFRTKFNWSGPAAGVSLVASNWVDDGLIAYLNGVEVSRVRIPAGPVTWDTLGENPPTEGVVEVRTWDSASLVQGENTLAVEVHQSSLTSSDVAMAISLSGVGPLTPLITDPFQPSNRVVLANRETTLSVGAIGSPAVSYQWYKDGNAIAGANGATLTIPQMSAADAGLYFCRVANVLGSVDSRTANVQYNFDDQPPAIVEISGSSTFDKVVIAFNELLDPVSANDSFNYSVTDGAGTALTISVAELASNGKSVTLTTDPQTPDTLYTVTVQSLADAAGNIMASPVSGTFRSWIPGPCNGVLFETYNVNNSLGIDDLINNQPNFPNNPRERLLITGFDSRLAYGDDSHENYGGRMTGLFIPPVSGNWVFHMRSDDPGRLFINPTGPSAAGKVRVGEQAGCCNAFPATAPQLSQPYELQAGKGYYVELLWREFGGGDYGQVAVALQGAPAPTVANLVDGMVGAGAAPANVGGGLTISQQPAGVSALANAVVTFSVVASNPNGLPLCYQWRRDGVDIPGATFGTYSFGPVSVAADNGAVFDCLVSVIGTQTASAQAALTVTEDVTKPLVVSVKGSTELTRIVIKFSEFVEVTSAEDEFNYTINGIDTLEAILAADKQSVTVKLRDPLTPDTQYTLSVSGVKDLSNNEMVAANIPFRTFALVPGFALAQYYFNLGGGVALTDLTGSPKYPSYPDQERYKGLFELNTFDEYESYGARMSGYIIPPVSGAYNFFMSSDDNGAFYLSTDASPANLVQVAAEPVWNGRRDWVGTARRNAAAPENRSATLFPAGINLTAGQMYYFEALVKEGGGGDNLAVAWQAPGAPEPLNGTTPISGIYMSSLADPSGALLRITQQPTDQSFIIASDAIANENFNSGNGGFTVDTPEAFNTPWTYAAGAWVVNQDGAEVNHAMTTRLTSPEYAVTKSGSLTLRFDHRYSFEFDGTRWDGGQVQISVNGGAYTAVPPTAFTQNGYVDVVAGNSRSALAGQPAFTATSTGHGAGTLITSVANLGSFNPGDKVRIRLVYSGDTNTGGTQPNWQVDNFQVNQGGGAAQNVTFAIAIEASKEGETTPTTFYQWMRDGGSGFVPVPGANGPSLTFTPVLADNGARYKCEVYIIGKHETSAVATLRVVVPNTPPRFTGGPNQTVNEDSGAHSVPNWATDISVHSIIRAPITYANDFSSGLAGMQAFGIAAVDAGVLKLTTPINSSYGAASISSAVQTYESLNVTWKSRVGGGAGGGADGYSLNIGADVPADPGYGGEEGIGTGLTVTVDTFDNGTGQDVGVDIKWGGTRVAYVNIPKDDDGSGNFLRKDAFVDASLSLSPAGVASLTYDGNTISATIPNYTGLRADRALFWGRTGGANDNQWVDDFSFSGFLFDSSSVENGQTIQFEVSNSNPSLFSVQPAVSPTGTLTYTPAPNAFGTATVTVRAKDSGGSEAGGSDTSAAFTFQIVINPINDCPTLASVPPLSTAAGIPVSGQLVGSDVDGDVLQYLITTPAQHGTLVLGLGTGGFTYTPAAGYTGPDSFVAVVSDPTGCRSAPVTVSITVGSANRCPTAVAKVQPNIELSAGQVETVIISSNGTNACMSLDGTQSSDPDGDALTHTWVVVLSNGSTIPLASGATATACLEVGTYTVRLIVDDGRCTRSADVAVEIITAGEAVDALIDKVNNATIDRKNKRPFIASLKAAVASFDRGSCKSGENQLKAFINKVKAQVAKANPAVATELIKMANDILAQIDCGEE